MEPFVFRRIANYYETDQMGVIHHSNYIRWMEEARVAWMNALGFGYKRMEACGVVSPVVGVTLDYHRPVRFDDEVEIEIRIKKYSGVVLELSYVIRFPERQGLHQRNLPPLLPQRRSYRQPEKGPSRIG